MPKFSTFSIYENEVREYISVLTSHTPIDKEKLTFWIYSEGITKFSKGLSSRMSHTAV